MLFLHLHGGAGVNDGRPSRLQEDHDRQVGDLVLGQVPGDPGPPHFHYIQCGLNRAGQPANPRYRGGCIERLICTS